MELYAGLIEFNWTLIFIWLTVITLYFIMKVFFFEKVYNFMKNRSNQIKDAFENADLANQAAAKKMEDYQRKIDQVEIETLEIIKDAQIKADIQAKSILDEANRVAEEKMKQADKEIEKEKLRAVSEMREQIAALAIFAAQKVLEQQLNVSGQDELFDQIIQEVEGSTWQS